MYLKRSVLLAVSLLLVSCQSSVTVKSDEPLSNEVTHKVKPKNIILFIGDGMGPAYLKAYRMYKDDLATPEVEKTLFDDLFVGVVRNSPLGLQPKKVVEEAVKEPFHWQYDGAITDSAAAATAYATGEKVLNGAIAMTPDGKSLPTVLEKAKYLGKSTGLVVTTQINDATPASFVAHQQQRYSYNSIADQYLDNRLNGMPYVDVMLGGGTKYFIRDDRNLASEFEALGYQYVETKAELLRSNNNKLIGLFAPVGMPKMFDRTDDIPSLADMTKVAIERLSENEKGFFLLVEGSQIDWAGHRNDIVGVVSEMQDFESALQVAMDFAKDSSDTQIIITADHSTGGLSVGAQYGKKRIKKWNRAAVHSFSKTADWIVSEAEITGDLLKAFQSASDLPLTEKEIKKLTNADTSDTKQSSAIVTGIVNRKSHTGWTGHWHTGEDIYLYAYGPRTEDLTGDWDNTEIGKLLFSLLE